ncbi:MAG: hypothetical protein KC620_15330, partial [Myxococcales bacterium]|nr:hypothetical protein [Myxococcales bacterium]
MRVFRGALLAALIAWPAFVAGQLGPRVCLPGNDAGNGLELAVDAQGVAHLSRVDRVAGTLLYTRVARDGTKVDEVVARDISVLAVSEVEDTGLLLDGAVARICFHDRRAQRMHLASRVAGVWSLATLEEGIDGDGCDVRRLGDTLFVVYEAGGRLRLASSVKGGPFLVTNLDRVDGHRVGLRPSIALGPAGEVAVAHRDGTNRTLRVVWNAGGAWHFEVPDVGFNDAGFAPRAVFTAAGQLTIFHAIEAGDLGANTDRGLVRTTMSLGGALESVRLPVDGIGGTHGAAFGARGLAVVTREYYRSALFGSYDGLHLFLGNDLVHSVIETYTPATARHTFRFARIALDPFALPVIAFLDDFSPRFNNPGGAPVCLRWPADEDEDGLPDVAEDELGTDPADPDTDGDGRSDGDEVLVDGTDPLVGGCAPASEACNGVDDDCDGIVDEGEVSCGVGACAQTVAACAGGADNLCAPLPPATDDVTCDGVDDDCDGAVDEGQVTCGVGVCARTVAACVGGAANVCTPLPAAPDDSSCDGFDDDCDGAVDEDCCDDVCQANLVPDGDMESAEPWLLDRAPACIKSAAAAYSGARGLACGPGGGRAYQTGIALAPGALYTLRVRYRVRAGTVIGYLGYSAPGGFVTLSGTDLYAAAPVAEWTTFTRVFRAPDDLDRALTWLFVADGEADLDDVALTALADDESLVADPSFEDATVSWVRYTSTGCAPIEGEAYNGAGALVCGNPAAGTRIGGLPLREGAPYCPDALDAARAQLARYLADR